MMKRNPLSSSVARHGTALIIVLWLTLGLAAMVVVFGHSMMLEYRVADNTLSALASGHAAEGALRYAAMLLRDEAEWGEAPDLSLHGMEEAAVGNSLFWLLGRTSELQGDRPAFGLVHESAKLHLNTATEEMLRALPNMTNELAAAIIDWRDADSDLTEGGAENQEYLLRSPAYSCKNAPFETVEELMLVMGMDEALLWGEDRNLNGYLDANEDDGDETTPPDDANGELDPGLMEYVTVYSREPNRTADRDARVNLTDQESESNLQSLLQEALGEERARSVMQASGNRQNMRSVLEFYTRSGLTLEECATLDEKLSTSDDAYLAGRININVAPRPVLAAIPGIGEENADAVIAWRESHAEESLASVRWLGEVLEAENANQAGPWVTTRTFQFSVDAVAVSLFGRGLNRMAAIVDTAEVSDSAPEPLVLFRKDRSVLGWPLGQTVREEIARSNGLED